jgi:hypothetical protein
VPFDRAGTQMEAFRDIVFFQSGRVEPLFQGLRLAFVAESVAEPNTLKRGDLLKSCATARLGRQERVAAY